MYSKTTNNVTVTVQPEYLESESSPESMHFVWSYRVQIKNSGDEALTLRSRYWKIIDSTGMVQEVRGEGVVGEQPDILPGEQYEYMSGAPLRTPGGIMSGQYHMEDQSGRKLAIDIPVFSLDSPYEQNIQH